MKRLENKVALITGGARGLGASHVKRFVAEGAKVYFTDLLEEEGLNLQKEIGEQAVFLKQDVASEDDWKAVIQTIEKAEEKLDVLVNNAGIGGEHKIIGEATLENFRKVLDVNLLSVFFGLTYALPLLKKSGKASVVNISSLAGQRGVYSVPAYTSAKFGVRGLTQNAALELGQFNIRANSVYPGAIVTPAMLAFSEEQRNKVIDGQAIKRSGQPEDITNAVLYLASDEASFVTGAELVVDGGALLS